ncbi:gas vesicle protein [Ectothiorhodospira haloalkaliphila]|uniref:gas vesicle protein n=1 Tax=Ectothiorhodospira haloalkaliphila TaxID=421628 RepID=UPI001EE8776A|nr:gas vesicle protein [Ectothiorhodospira haloalkaliphila]MCG5526132.1 gas vesicle protein [Ectothiorhodospira haloalkaliphila]
MPRDNPSLCEALDQVLDKGVVVSGEIIISVADIHLVYVGLTAVVASVETLREKPAVTPIAEPIQTGSADPR